MVCMSQNFSQAEGHLGVFQFGAVNIKVALDIYVPIFL